LEPYHRIYIQSLHNHLPLHTFVLCLSSLLLLQDEPRPLASPKGTNIQHYLQPLTGYTLYFVFGI
jgi:hypothetical protein